MNFKNINLTICIFALLAVFLLGTASIPESELCNSEINKEAAQKAYERFKLLEGKWTGKNSEGWEAKLTYRVIANGSVVMEILEFDDRPEETMVTMFHMDGDKLMLTHYCAAKNQPRMVAKKINEDGTKLTFEYLDSTNMQNRDEGHMDKAKVNFKDGDKDYYSSQWTWYQEGNEMWMEEFTYKRIK